MTSDVPGAYVFLDRKFLGTTPFSSRDVAPGTYQLNVQVEGRPPVVRTVEVLPEGLTEVAVTLPAAAKSPAAAATLSAEVAVVHQHAMGSCEGILRASGDGFRYDTPHKDAFTLPFARVETFAVDYAEKRLRLKQRGGPHLELHDHRRRTPTRCSSSTATSRPHAGRAACRRGRRRRRVRARLPDSRQSGSYVSSESRSQRPGPARNAS